MYINICKDMYVNLHTIGSTTDGTTRDLKIEGIIPLIIYPARQIKHNSREFFRDLLQHFKLQFI